MILTLDFESYSEADIRKCGAYAYAAHPSTEALMLAWAIDDEPVQLWNIHRGEQMPSELDNALIEAEEIRAFNATFERLILKHCLGWPIEAERFNCSMVRAYGLAFTGGLDDVIEQLGLPTTKDPRGKALIRRFSQPQPKNHNVRRWTQENDPKGYAEFMEYCRRDVEAERGLAKALEPYEQAVGERELYNLDQKINDKGVPVDRSLVGVALEINAEAKRKLNAKLKELTGLDNPNSNTQLQQWLASQGLELPNMQKDTIEKAIESSEGLVKQVLLLKQQLAKTSVTKWKAFDRSLCDDDTCKGMFQFVGASRTGRWAGRLVQLQNLARGGNTTRDPDTLCDVMLSGGHDAVEALYGTPLMALSDSIRGAITAPEGKMLVVADLASIESRVVGWLTNCSLMNRTFAEGKDTYKVFASQMYGVEYDDVTPHQRKMSKPATLGCAYYLGAKGLIGYAEGMGVEMTEDESQESVDTFRSMYHEIVTFWREIQDAVFYVTQTGSHRSLYGLDVFAHGEFLFIRMPSGRCIPYHKPRVELREAPWGDMIDNFTYMAKDRFTLKWQRIHVHAGGITENLIQGIARDILGCWMTRADDAGFNIVGHVHDEIICVENKDRLEELCELSRQPIEWADGLLLDADGYVAKRYRKD